MTAKENSEYASKIDESDICGTLYEEERLKPSQILEQRVQNAHIQIKELIENRENVMKKNENENESRSENENENSATKRPRAINEESDEENDDYESSKKFKNSSSCKSQENKNENENENESRRGADGNSQNLKSVAVFDCNDGNIADIDKYENGEIEGEVKEEGGKEEEKQIGKEEEEKEVKKVKEEGEEKVGAPLADLQTTMSIVDLVPVLGTK